MAESKRKKVPKSPTKISELIPDKRNYNKHSEYGMSLMNKSLSQFGLHRSIVLDKNNKIIAGNATVETAGTMGLEDVQVIESDGKRLIAVKRTDIDLDTKKGRELALADNATAKANITWDTELISQDWGEDEQKEWGITLDFESELEVQEDNYEIPSEIETDIVLGDLFEIGQHRLLCGDSTKADDVARLMNGEKADMILTDPPYGINLETKADPRRPINYGKHNKRNSYDKIIGDNKDFDASFIFEHFDCKEIFLWGADYYRTTLLKGGSWFVWDKRYGLEDVEFTQSEFELLWSKQKHHRKILRVAWFGICGTEKQDIKKRIHAAQKPIKVITPIITDYSKSNGPIVDLFIGSGTTMVAAHQLNRKCYGMEISKEYCSIILRRMKKLDNSLVIRCVNRNFDIEKELTDCEKTEKKMSV